MKTGILLTNVEITENKSLMLTFVGEKTYTVEIDLLNAWEVIPIDIKETDTQEEIDEKKPTLKDLFDK